MPVIRLVGSGNDVQLCIEGMLDALTVGQLVSAIDRIAADHPSRVTVDLDGVSLIDSMGVSAIIALWKRITAEGGSVVVVHAHDQPLVVLKVLKLDALLGVVSPDRRPGGGDGRDSMPRARHTSAFAVSGDDLPLGGPRGL